MNLPVFPRNISYRARPKSPPFHFFSALRDIFFGFFFRNFFFRKGSPLHFFWCFATEWMLENPKGFLLSVFFGIVRFSPENKKIFFFNFFMFCDRMDVEKPQRVPLFSFSALWDVSAPGARGSEPRRATRSIFLVCNFFKKKIFEKFSSFDYCKRILDTWKSFCYFWALDMAPTWAGPGLFYFNTSPT